jgi:predicted Holliday junction resolvase-like endonuclease
VTLAIDPDDLALGILIGAVAVWVYVLLWKVGYTRRVRDDAVLRSQAVTAGKVHEQLLPYLPAFPFDPRDARFLGSPVDLVVFDGLAQGRVRRIVFVEVKTGGAGLTMRERMVRDVVQEGEVEWVELRTAPRASGVA